jgi:hypothetical protein
VPPDDRLPSDLIPAKGLTLAALSALNVMAGKAVTVTEPGDVVLDVDGFPIGVGPTTTSTATLAAPTISRAELDQLGGNPDDFPNLKFR